MDTETTHLHYTVTDIPPAEMTVTRGRNKWNLGYADRESVLNNPITTAGVNTTFIAVAELRHVAIPELVYLLEDKNTPHGWMADDCTSIHAALVVDDGRTYTVLKYEKSIVTIARKLGIPVQDLLDHNNDDNFKPYDLIIGQKLHLPYAVKDITPKITYEHFLTVDEAGRHVPTTKLFHLVRDARKWSFSDYRSLKHITEDTGTFPKYKELELVAIAYVPVGGEDRPYAYVMDLLSYADYDTTGKVRYTRGFNYADLAEGHAPAKPEPDPSEVLELTKQQAHIKAVMADVPLPTKQILTNTLEQNRPTAWKGQYEAFPDGDRAYIIVPTVSGEDRIRIYDLEDATFERYLPVGDKRIFSGLIWKDGLLYGRIKRTNTEQGYICIPKTAMKRYIKEQQQTAYEPVLDEPWSKNELIMAKSSQIKPLEKFTINGFAMAELTASRIKFYGSKVINKGKKQ